MNTAFTDRFGIRYPIVQAPMAGGPTTPEMVIAVSEAGGLGSLAGGYVTPDVLSQQISVVRANTDNPFAVNLFVPANPDVTADAQAMWDALQGAREALGIFTSMPAWSADDHFLEKVQIVLSQRVPIVSFTFGIPDAAVLHRFKEEGRLLVGSATSVAEARQLEASGMDAIVAQGSEAGGHRGTFFGDRRPTLIGTIALTPQIVDAVNIPVLAAGGVMDGRGLAAVLALGAAGAQMGTAFLRAKESGASALLQRALVEREETETVVTRALTGKYARGFHTTFIEQLEKGEVPIPDYPIQHALTSPIRKAAAASGEVSFMSLWAGQGHRMAASLGAGDLVVRFAQEAAEIFARFSE
ncbi:nitronate monooxygenase [Ferroacidibacillus organovorans]|uniref:Probable nitronate monooxygenase n=1 Tax=Ferroacidibacillus organovorans TaxID=1765683 RepID=A0A853KFU6_9BACL|nr:nitronate monooxygenase [Ferroacidibacillus organovorans]KYP81391.1 hypothetical protein AYJ22_01100 [Ferroacidibacillus organovorans]OAG95178.1 hypothetical protein AYW79_01700 [Ferroacidibacillus organovorans]